MSLAVYYPISIFQSPYPRLSVYKVPYLGYQGIRLQYYRTWTVRTNASIREILVQLLCSPSLTARDLSTSPQAFPNLGGLSLCGVGSDPAICPSVAPPLAYLQTLILWSLAPPQVTQSSSLYPLQRSPLHPTPFNFSIPQTTSYILSAQPPPTHPVRLAG